MNAKEIRIDNYLFMDKDIVQVRTVSEHGFNFGLHGYAANIMDWWKPIPLTEEWLLKFGFMFEKNHYGYSFPEHSDWLLEFNKANNKWWVRYGLEKIDCERLSYVHQLQNLVFALTGEELKLSE